MNDVKDERRMMQGGITLAHPNVDCRVAATEAGLKVSNIFDHSNVNRRIQIIKDDGYLIPEMHSMVSKNGWNMRKWMPKKFIHMMSFYSKSREFRNKVGCTNK